MQIRLPLVQVIHKRIASRSAAQWLIVGFWVALLPLYAVWLWRDQITAPWDLSGHSKLAFDAWHHLCNGRIDRIYTLSNYYPPLFHVITAPLTLISSHPDVYCAANWFILLFVMGSTFLIGRHLAGEYAGLAAAFLLPAYLQVSWLCRMPMTDLALTATVVWSLWILLRGELLTNRRNAHALGIWIGLGMLAKWPYLFFMALPILYCAWKQRSRTPGQRLKDWLSAYPLLVWPLALAGPWYARALPNIIEQAGRHFGNEIALADGDPALISLASVFAYPWYLYEFYMRVPLLLLVIIAVAVLCWRLATGRAGTDPARRGWMIPALAFCSGFVILTLITNKDHRYIVPLVPAIAVFSTQWIAVLAPAAQRWSVAAVALLAYGMVVWNLFVYAPPNPREMGIEALAEWVVARPIPGTQSARVLVIPNSWELNARAVNYALYRRNKQYGARPARSPVNRDWFQYYEYILVTDPPEETTGVAPHVKRNTDFVRVQEDWGIVARFPRGDGRELVLLARHGRSDRD